MRWDSSKLYCGGKDGVLVVIDTATLSVEKSYKIGFFIRSIDIKGGNALLGLGDGSIIEFNLGSENKKVLMESHSEGETWGLAVVDKSTVITSGDDN